MELRAQGSRPRTQKNIRGQRQPFREQTLSRARTQAQVFSKKKKIMSLKIFFRCSQKTKIKKSPKKTNFPTKNDLQNFKDSKYTAVLEPRTGLFSRTCSFEAKDFKMCPRGLHLCKRNVSGELKNS